MYAIYLEVLRLVKFAEELNVDNQALPSFFNLTSGILILLFEEFFFLFNISKFGGLLLKDSCH